MSMCTTRFARLLLGTKAPTIMPYDADSLLLCEQVHIDKHTDRTSCLALVAQQL